MLQLQALHVDFPGRRHKRKMAQLKSGTRIYGNATVDQNLITTKLGIGTAIPNDSLDVVGTIGIHSSGSANLFRIQHNTQLNSLDFIFV